MWSAITIVDLTPPLAACMDLTQRIPEVESFLNRHAGKATYVLGTLVAKARTLPACACKGAGTLPACNYGPVLEHSEMI